MIYFIQCMTRVKIGFTRHDPNKRLKSLQTGNPHELKLLKVIKGDLGLETSLHYKFRKHRINGEWFEFDDSIKNYIDNSNSIKVEKRDFKYDGERPHTIRMDNKTFKLVQDYIDEFGCTKSTAIRQLIRMGFASAKDCGLLQC